MITTKAFVISTLKYKDNSLIVKCYTEALGVQSYLLKGVFKSSKAGLKRAYFQPLMFIEIVATTQKKGTLEYIKEARPFYHYKNLYSDMVKNSVAFFLSEIAYTILVEEYCDKPMFWFWEHYLQWYDQATTSGNFHLKFLVDLTQYLGFYPDISSINHPYFDIEAGVFVPEQNGNHLFSTQQTQWLKSIMQTDLKNISNIQINRQQRNEFLDLIFKYYSWHLPNFRLPKSWEILRIII